MKKQAMTEDQLKSFVENVHNYHHKHEEVDITKDIAFYILDLLRQGYSVQGILSKLKGARELASAHMVIDLLRAQVPELEVVHAEDSKQLV